MKKAALKKGKQQSYNSTLRTFSNKQIEEINQRVELRRELIRESHGVCMTCKQFPDWRGLSLSHKVPLSRGGETTRENCVVECYDCHGKYEKHPEKRKEN